MFMTAVSLAVAAVPEGCRPSLPLYWPWGNPDEPAAGDYQEARRWKPWGQPPLSVLIRREL